MNVPLMQNSAFIHCLRQQLAGKIIRHLFPFAWLGYRVELWYWGAEVYETKDRVCTNLGFCFAVPKIACLIDVPC